jgi:hypothetical protein
VPVVGIGLEALRGGNDHAAGKHHRGSGLRDLFPGFTVGPMTEKHRADVFIGIGRLQFLDHAWEPFDVRKCHDILDLTNDRHGIIVDGPADDEIELMVASAGLEALGAGGDHMEPPKLFEQLGHKIVGKFLDPTTDCLPEIVECFS